MAREGNQGYLLARDALAYANTLFTLARYLSGNETDAEDLVQETYARALHAADRFTPGTNLKAWLFRILRNTFLSQARRRRSSPIVGGLDTVQPIHADAAADNWLRDDVELDRLRKVVADEIEQALLRLSEEAHGDPARSGGAHRGGGGRGAGVPGGHGEVSPFASARHPPAPAPGLRAMTAQFACADIRLRLLDYQRGTLVADEHDAVRAHLDACSACAHEDMAEATLSHVLERRLPEHPAPIALKRRLGAWWATASEPTPPAGRRRWVGRG